MPFFPKSQSRHTFLFHQSTLFFLPSQFLAHGHYRLSAVSSCVLHYDLILANLVSLGFYVMALNAASDASRQTAASAENSTRHSSLSSSASSTSAQSQYLPGQSVTTNPIIAANQRRYADFLARSFNLSLDMVQPAG